jgi:hypothetical protein
MECFVQAEACFPVSVVMECTRSSRGPWRLPVWQLVGFVAGEAVAGGHPRRLRVRTETGREHWLWTGLRLALFRDSAESYWYNLTGRQPSLFLICREDAPGEPAPFMVTANYDEAGAHLEADDLVFAAPIPPELHLRLEAFVMRHYQPQPPEKRKRVDWTGRTDDGWKPSPRLARP